MPHIEANDLHLAYDEVGSGPPVVMIMGIGAQRVLWPDELLERFAGAGYRAIRFDNRDIGESTRLHEAPVPPVVPSMLRAIAKRPVEAPYTLSDMATDTAALMDALQLPRAHILGASMGGMIAQHLALEHPERVATLTSVMSGPGSVRHMLGKPRAIRALLSRPPTTRQEAQAHTVRLFQAIGGTLPQDLDQLRATAGIAWDRGPHPEGFARQWAAIMASGSRLRELRRLSAPTLVVHGTHDPLVPPRAGKATAEAIPGARMLWVPGMGHDFAPAAIDHMLPAVLDHFARHPL